MRNVPSHSFEIRPGFFQLTYRIDVISISPSFANAHMGDIYGIRKCRWKNLVSFQKYVIELESVTFWKRQCCSFLVIDTHKRSGK